MKTETIRKNATKKIKALLDSSVKIIYREDSCDYVAHPSGSIYRYVDRVAVLDWLADKSKYEYASLTISDSSHLLIMDTNYYSSKFDVFLSDEALTSWITEFRQNPENVIVSE